MYVVTSCLPNLLAIFKSSRENCAVLRNSETCPCGVLLKGIVAKFEAMLLCVFVVRKIFSKSRNPPGVNTSRPILTDDCPVAPWSAVVWLGGFEPALLL